MRVLIIGCGIGGAVASLALEKAGIEHAVFEQAGALTEVGAGLQLSPNASRVLEWLGIGPALAAVGVAPRAHIFLDGLTGQQLLKTPLMPEVRDHFGAPYYHVHRAQLLEILTSAMDASRIRLGARVRALRAKDDNVEVELEDGRVEQGDIVIGADGIHSVVRQQVFDPAPPRNAGCIAWRGLLDAQIARSLGFEENAYAYMGPRRCAVLYYVGAGSSFNWVGIGPYSENTKESWSQVGSVEAALAQYADWSPTIKRVIGATENLFITALADREPLDRWVAGRVALLGDAAHAMLPYHAQGAAQAIEDAWALARCLERGADDPQAALGRYESLRRERANVVQKQSRQFRRTWELSEPDEIAARNARFARHQRAARDGYPVGQQWLYGYDAEKAVLGTDDEWRALQW